MAFKLFLGRYRLEPIIGTFSLAVMVIATTHFFIDLLLITTFKQAQSQFQHFYLFVHFICLILTMLLMTYGFAIVHKPNYHAICNFRSWTLLLSMFLGFSGSFACLGFGLDWTLFHHSCMENIFSASVAASVAQINLPITHNSNDSKDRFDGEQTCKGTFDGLLCTQLILYVAMEICIIILFFNVNSFKSTRFEKEDQISAIRKRKQLAERNQRLGVQPQEEGDEVEGINIQHAEIEEMEDGKGKSVTFAKDLDGSPISDSDYTNFISSPSTDHERSPPVEGFLGGRGASYRINQTNHSQQNKSQLLPHFHLPLSSPFSIFRTPKSSMNGAERNPLFEASQSPFSASIPTPPPICSPLQNEDDDVIVPISPFEVMRNDTNHTAYPLTYKPPYQRYDRMHQQQEHSIQFPVQQSNDVPKIIVDYYDDKGKVHTDDPIKRAIKSFIASKDH